jgi:Protein of unknwon function (DUF3310)
MTTNDADNKISHPAHYQGASPIGRELLGEHFYATYYELDGECIDFIEYHWEFCNFHLGNAIKYLWRCGIKGDTREDLSKALWYLRRWESDKMRSFVFMFLSMASSPKRRTAMRSKVSALANAIELKLSQLNS